VNDKTGVMTGHNKTYALCGFIRAMVHEYSNDVLCTWFFFQGESDDAINRLAEKDGVSSGYGLIVVVVKCYEYYCRLGEDTQK